MPSIFFTVINPFSPEKKKLRDNAADYDDLTAVKAAAWAWYERGAGSESKPMPAFDIARTQKTPGPSRYKLEAMSMTEKATKAKVEENQTRYRFHPLLDSHEIESISKHFGSFVEPGRRSFQGEFVSVESFRWSSRSPASKNGDRIKKKKKKKKKNTRKKETIGGIWLKRAPVCGIGKDTVDDRAIVSFRSPIKHSRAAKVGK